MSMLRLIMLLAGALMPVIQASAQAAVNETVQRAASPDALMTLVLPTDNDALLRGRPEDFYMFVDRNFENELTTPWEGGSYGYVRGPVRTRERVELMHFHEGVDIAPVKRDERGEPQDEVRSISHGEVVHGSDAPGASNYGRYLVIKHDWGQGLFFSLYAHLSRILVKVGDKVEPGTPIAIMGHTGTGINVRRSHTHLELNLILNSRFAEWHDANFKDYPNKHGNFNGLNLAGLDIAALYLARQKNPSLTVADFVKAQQPAFRVLVPRKEEIELRQNYPWLGENTSTPSPSWELTFSGGGLPLKIQPAMEKVAAPKVSWVRNEDMPISYHTRGYLSGSASKFYLTASGLRYVQLITGDFTAPAGATEKPAVTTSKKPPMKKAAKK
jgi:murein DD-endopeptidase MepM/ murein hydrolase activator NlpD